jgi:hypothetical protein
VLGHAPAAVATLAPVRLLLEAELARIGGRDARPYLEALATAPANAGSTLLNHRVLGQIELSFARGEVAALEAQVEACAASEQHGYEMLALLRLGMCLCRRGQPGDALLLTARAQTLLDEGAQPIGVGRGELLLALVELLNEAGATAAARRWAGKAVEWLHCTAVEHVPADFRDSFLQRHPAHARLLSWGAGRARAALA